VKVTVITVCYNAASTIGDTIDSVEAQDHADIEHIVVDGASSDETLRILHARGNDRMRIISEPDSGLYNAMNKGLNLASGGLIGFLNADDFFCRTDAIRCLVSAAEENPDAQAVAGGVAIVNSVLPMNVVRSYSSYSFRPWMLRFGHMPPHPGFYVRRPALAHVGGFNEQFRIAADFDWMVRFFEVHKFSVKKLRQTLVCLRAGGISTRGLRSTAVINREMGLSLARHSCFSSSILIWSKYGIKITQMALPPDDYPAPVAVRWTPGPASNA
jgi:glycosyltransferase involved in cell wall biosynthesis